jgi:hypothetical protein
MPTLGFLCDTPMPRSEEGILSQVMGKCPDTTAAQIAKELLTRLTRQIFLGQTPEANDDFFRLGFTEIYDSPKHRLTTLQSPGHHLASLMTS